MNTFNASAVSKALAKLATKSNKKIWVIAGGVGYEWEVENVNTVLDVEKFTYNNNTFSEAKLYTFGKEYPLSKKGLILHNEGS